MKLIIVLLFINNFAFAQNSDTCVESRLDSTPQIPSELEQLGRDCSVPQGFTLELSENDACECIESLPVPSNPSVYSREIEVSLKTPSKVALMHLSNEISSLSEAYPRNVSPDFTSTCNLESLKNTQCPNEDPLLSSTEINKLITSFQNTMLNNSETERFRKPDFAEGKRSPDGCKISDATIMKINHNVDTSRIALIVDLAKAIQESNPNNSATNLSELLRNSEAGVNFDERDRSAIESLIFSSTNSPLIRNFLNSPDVLTRLKNPLDENPPFSSIGTLNLLRSNSLLELATNDVAQKCVAIIEKVARTICTSKSETHPTFSQLGDLLSSSDTDRTAANNNADLTLYCKSDRLDQQLSFTSELPGYLKENLTQDFEVIFNDDYSGRILTKKRPDTTQSVGAINNVTLSMCDYIPQPGLDYKQADVDKAINENCYESGEEIPFAYMCLQARAVKLEYGPKLLEISELEEKITLAESDSTQTQTIEYNGEVLSVTDARARRELLATNLFSQDMTKPAIIEEFITGKRSERPTQTASANSAGNTSSTETSTQGGNDSASTQAVTASSSSGRSSEFTSASVLQSNRQDQPDLSNNQDYISQAQRDQNTRDLFNEVQRRIDAGNTRSSQERSRSNSASRSSASELASASSRTSSPLNSFQSNMLRQSTSHIPADRFRSSNNNQGSQAQGGGFLGQADPNNNGEATVVDPNESFNDALGDIPENERILARSTGATSSGRSPASAGGASAAPAPSILAISGSDSATNGEEAGGSRTVRVPSDQPNNANIIELSAVNADSAEEMISLMEAIRTSEINTIVIQKGDYRVTVERDGEFLRVTSSDNVRNPGLRAFIRNIKNTMNDRSISSIVETIERAMCKNSANSSNDRCSDTPRLRDF